MDDDLLQPVGKRRQGLGMLHGPGQLLGSRHRTGYTQLLSSSLMLCHAAAMGAGYYAAPQQAPAAYSYPTPVHPALDPGKAELLTGIKVQTMLSDIVPLRQQ